MLAVNAVSIKKKKETYIYIYIYTETIAANASGTLRGNDNGGVISASFVNRKSRRCQTDIALKGNIRKALISDFEVP